MNKYRVLVVDDKESVLNRIKYEIKPKLVIDDDTWNIKIIPLHVKVNGSDEDEKYSIDENTILELGDYSKKPYDLILLDFGFKKEGSKILDTLRERYKDNLNIDKLEGKILNPNDLIKTCIEIGAKKHNKELISNINKNFILHRSKILIYTYIHPALKKYVPSSGVRENITSDLFPAASSIELLDTRVELFNDDEFNEKYDERFYSYLIAKYLNTDLVI